MTRKYRKHKNYGRDVQRHHLEYQQGKFEDKTGPVVLIYRGEHWVITQLQRRTYISKGLIEALKFWINEREGDAVELSVA